MDYVWKGKGIFQHMILIHPPVAKPCEPPGGIARLSGALNAHGTNHILLDLNLEALLYTLL
jgi:hypothetical protein